MPTIRYEGEVRLAALRIGETKGSQSRLVEGVLDAIATDVARRFNSLTHGPPDFPNRRSYGLPVEGLGAVEAIVEDQGDELVIVSLRVEAWDC